ncbi:MAG TPA: alpha-2-macroglobulin [Candidatus Binataceae bacterium]|nr:alpha-2-macroglobulin [Candidatus Binataceae bacterium]
MSNRLRNATKALGEAGRILVQFLTALLGEVRWSPPAWMRSTAAALWDSTQKSAAWLAAQRAKNPRRFWASIVSIALFVAGGFAGLNWYRHRPIPRHLEVSTIWPHATPLKPGAVPEPFRIQFSGSAAPLGAIGKPVTSGITVTPPLAGEWRWDSDSELLFTPAHDWEVGQDYTIDLDRRMFPSHVLLAKYSVILRSPAFRASIDQAQFYEDPTNPKIKEVVATVSFTHPVDKTSFEKRVSMRMRVLPVKDFDSRDAKSFGFKVTYDDAGGTAYIHSDPFPIPNDEAFMLLAIDSGVRSSRGGPPAESSLARIVSVPGLGSYFHIDGISAAEVLNDHDDMDRIGTIASSVPLRQADLEKSVSVFLLPKDRPAIGDLPVELNYQWTNPLEVVPKVMALATPLPVEWIPTEREYSPVQSFKFTADAGRFLLVTIKRGLKSFGDYPLNKDYSAVIPAREFPKTIKIMSKGSLLSLTGEKKISILTRSVDSIQFEVSRVLPGGVSHLVAQTSGTFSEPEFAHRYGSRSFDFNDLSEVFTQVRQLGAKQGGGNQYTVFDFAPLLSTGALPRGLFSLKIQEWDPENKKPVEGGATDERLILLTDLGLLVKDSADGTHDVFVQSIRTGEPLSSAAVEILGRNGLPIFTQKTDGNGRVRFPPLKDFIREKTPTVYVVEKENDFSFLPYDRADRKLNFSRFDTGGLYTTETAGALQAFLFSDRGIYRPGEKIHLGIIVKPADWRPLPAGLPLKIVVTDPRGHEIHREPLKFSPAGFEEFSTSTREDSPTGSYQFSLYIVRDNHQDELLGSTSVRVEDFQPDRLTIKAELSAPASDGWISPDNLSAGVPLRNLFGTPAVGRRVQGSFTLSPSYVSFGKYPDYHFADPYATKKSFEEQLGDLTTDADGRVKFDLKLDRFEQGVYSLRFVAEGFEPEGGRSVITETGAIVSPAAYLIAFKPDADLNYIAKGARRSVNLIAVGPNLEKTAVPGLSTELIEFRYVSVLTKQDNGTLAYQSVLKEISKQKESLAIPATGLMMRIPTADPGSLAIVIRNQKGMELNRIHFEVAGRANVSRSLEREAELKIKLSKPEYAPGETAEIAIQAPYVGAGLITVEREKIYNIKWFKTTTTESVQKIKIPAELDGNGYITVTFVRSLDSPEIFTSPLSYGAEPFRVSRARHTESIKLDTPDLVRPGDKLTIKYQTGGPARIVVYAVDEGILQVARYKTPDPLSYFFRKRALEVETSQILDLVLPELHLLSQASAPGGGEEETLAKTLNPFKRKGQPPVVFWSGIIDSDGKPGTFEVQVPDYFNGTLRVMAVAAAPGTAGAAERNVVSQGYFTIQPQAPYYSTPGDEFEMTALVANNTGQASKEAMPVKVSLDTSAGLEVIGDTSQRVQIAPGSDLTVAFKVRAKKVLGPATMVVEVSGADKSARYSLDMSIRPASPFVTTLSGGYVKKSLLQSVKAELPVQRKMYPEYRDVSMSASVLPMGLASGLIQYLVKFPYGCTEQITSQAFPAVILGTRPELGLNSDEAQKSLARAIATLEGRQNAAGAFGLWSAGAYVSDFVNAYAVHFLIEMREHDLDVPQELLDRALNSLREFVATPASTLPELRAQAYALYVLARSGTLVTNQLDTIREALDQNFPKVWTDDVTALYLASTYKLLRMDSQAGGLMSYAPAEHPHATGYDDYYYDDLVYRAAYFYLVSKHFPDRAKKITGDELLAFASSITSGRANTISSAYSILALDAYSKTAGSADKAKIAFTETLADKSVHPLPSQGEIFARADVPAEATSVGVTADTPFALFYQLVEGGFDIEPPTAAIKNHIEVFRDFRNEKGDVITSSPLESKVDVYVSLRAIDDPVGNVAVVDLLPGGFEVDISPEGLGNRTSLVQGSDTWRPDYIDVREDRVIFYGTITPNAQKFVYRLKPTNPGKFVVPPLYAEGMYDRTVQARSLGGNFTIEEDSKGAK